MIKEHLPFFVDVTQNTGDPQWDRYLYLFLRLIFYTQKCVLSIIDLRYRLTKCKFVVVCLFRYRNGHHLASEGIAFGVAAHGNIDTVSIDGAACIIGTQPSESRYIYLRT